MSRDAELIQAALLAPQQPLALRLLDAYDRLPWYAPLAAGVLGVLLAGLVRMLRS